MTVATAPDPLPLPPKPPASGTAAGDDRPPKLRELVDLLEAIEDLGGPHEYVATLGLREPISVRRQLAHRLGQLVSHSESILWFLRQQGVIPIPASGARRSNGR